VSATTNGEPTNAQRAAWANTALTAFAGETGQDRSGDLAYDTVCVVIDLLCDLQHLCAQRGIDFAGAMRCAVDHFAEEQGDEAATL